MHFIAKNYQSKQIKKSVIQVIQFFKILFIKKEEI